jgi:hypothetical protein
MVGGGLEKVENLGGGRRKNDSLWRWKEIFIPEGESLFILFKFKVRASEQAIFPN